MARFTPVTTATSALPRASRTELVRHEPPGRSTNSTAGRAPIAAVSRAARAPESQPSFDTGTSASPTPVMTFTAATNAWATAEWETITPLNGSLIIFLEVFLQLAPLRHPLEQPLVEGPCRVDAAVAQQMVHRHDLADHGQVLPWVERDRHERQSDVEQLRRLAVEPGAVVLARRVPVLELHHHFDPLLLAHGTDAEQRADVDQADTADFHVMARQLVPATDQHVVPLSRDVHQVVRNEAMAALHEIEHALALADTGAAQKQEAHPEYVGEGGVHRGAGRERVVQKRLEPSVELGRLELGADHRHALGPRQLDQLGGRLLAFGNDDTRQVEPEEGLERPAPLGRPQRVEISDLGFAQDVDALRGEPLGIARQHEAGARRLGRRNLPVEPDVSREGLELERIALTLEQVAHPEAAHRGSRSRTDRAVARRRRRVFLGSALSSCRRTRATARSSAERWSGPSALPTWTTPRAACSRTSTLGLPWSAVNVTCPSCGRTATLHSRSSSVRARSRSSSGISQCRAVMVTCMDQPP